MSYEPDSLPYEYGALEPHISERALTWHHDTHHQSYVNDWSATEEALAENRETDGFDSSADALRDITHNGSGHILHDLFWQNMSPESGGEPEGTLVERIAEDFGSYGAWKGEFGATTGAAGSWALLVYGSFSNQLQNVVVDKHNQGALWGSRSILALDVWEHSCYRDYGPTRDDSVSAFFEVVDWDEPTTRYERVVELLE